ncbi:MAG: ribosome maturation factor RimM [Sphingomonadaceae bacterium]
MPLERIVLAEVAGAHGLRGELRLKLFAEGIESLERHEVLFIGGSPHSLEAVREGRRGAIARFAEIADRAAAEALRGEEVSVAREALPPLEEGEYYHADLIDLPCVDRAGETLGIVVAVGNFGAGDILEIERPDGTRAMLPFRRGVAELEEEVIVADPAFLA